MSEPTWADVLTRPPDSLLVEYRFQERTFPTGVEPRRLRLRADGALELDVDDYGKRRIWAGRVEPGNLSLLLTTVRCAGFPPASSPAPGRRSGFRRLDVSTSDCRGRLELGWEEGAAHPDYGNVFPLLDALAATASEGALTLPHSSTLRWVRDARTCDPANHVFLRRRQTGPWPELLSRPPGELLVHYFHGAREGFHAVHGFFEVTVAGEGKARVEASRGGPPTVWEGRLDAAEVARLPELLRAAEFPEPPPAPCWIMPDTTFARLGVRAGPHQAAVEVPWRSREADAAYRALFRWFVDLVDTKGGRRAV